MQRIPEGSFHSYIDTAEQYANFSRVEARDSSPLYEVLAAGVSTDPAVLSLLQRVPAQKRQPNLLFASVLYLDGVQLVVQGDLVDLVVEVAATAPPEATLVVFHSAVLNYLPQKRRRAFAELVSERPWTWISNEGPGVVESLQLNLALPDPNCFVVGVGPSDVMAFAHPHGRWVEWVSPP